MAIKSWGISSCKKCTLLNAFENTANVLLGVASPRTGPLVKEIQRIHEEEITDHILWHAEHAKTHQAKR